MTQEQKPSGQPAKPTPPPIPPPVVEPSSGGKFPGEHREIFVRAEQELFPGIDAEKRRPRPGEKGRTDQRDRG